MRRKQRSFSAEFKVRVVLEYLTGQKCRAEILREHQLDDGTLDRWIKQFQERAAQVFVGDDRTEIAERDQWIAGPRRAIVWRCWPAPSGATRPWPERGWRTWRSRRGARRGGSLARR